MPKPEKRVHLSPTEYHLNALFEAVKTYVRSWLLTISPIVVTFLLAGIDTNTGAIDINWILLRAIVLANSLSFIGVALDRYKHVYTKAKNPTELEGRSAGLLKF